MFQVDMFLLEVNMRQYFYIFVALDRSHCGSFLFCGGADSARADPGDGAER
jgi:hypothetical protein